MSPPPFEVGGALPPSLCRHVRESRPWPHRPSPPHPPASSPPPSPTASPPSPTPPPPPPSPPALPPPPTPSSTHPGPGPRKKTNAPKFLREATVSRFIGHQSAILGAVEVHERALYCLWPEHPLRRLCIELANHPYYTNFNLCLILVNCVTLMIESGRTLGTNYAFTDLNSSLNAIDATFAAFFSLRDARQNRSGWAALRGPLVVPALLLEHPRRHRRLVCATQLHSVDVQLHLHPRPAPHPPLEGRRPTSPVCV